MAQPAAHCVHSVARSSENLTARPHVRSFIDRHFNRRLFFGRKNLIEGLVSMERSVSIDALCFRYWHPLTQNPHRTGRSRQRNWGNHHLHEVGIRTFFLAHANCTLFFTSRAAFVCKKETRSFRVFPPENRESKNGGS